MSSDFHKDDHDILVTHVEKMGNMRREVDTIWTKVGEVAKEVSDLPLIRKIVYGIAGTSLMAVLLGGLALIIKKTS